ncbi:MAG: primosomal protein N' [Candidatus Zhuqueibacterota bacterium]
MKYADVAIPLPIFQTYTYEIPAALEDLVLPGARVLIPLGKRKRITGYVVSVNQHCEREDLKPIYDLLDEQPALLPELLQLALWISEYYIAPLGEVIKAMLPGGINLESQRLLKLIKTEDEVNDYLQANRAPGQEKLLRLLLENRQISVQQIRKKFKFPSLSLTIQKLVQAGLIVQDTSLTRATANIKYETWLRLSERLIDPTDFNRALEQLPKSATSQITCLKILFGQKEISQTAMLRSGGFGSSILKTLADKGYLVKYQKEVFRSYFPSQPMQPGEKFELNSDQAAAVQQIEKQIDTGKFSTFLVFGVTGSGKTQVYIESIRHVLEKGKTAIVLVPEISLTPQTVARFTQNFPNLVAVLHSRMSPGERFDSWRKLRNHEFKIAVGPRSAIFAPLQNLGLIVVDEEHESSYKQYDSQPLYHARDVAVYRGMRNEAVVILGSATPSLESYYNAKTKKYQLIELPRRIENISMPTVELIDMKVQKRRYPKQDVSIFSKELQIAIQQRLELGQQMILLQNRRGYSTFIQCKDCGFIEMCENCNITLTYHLTNKTLRCHYCNFTKQAPESCRQCGSSNIQYQGIGTQKVDKEITRLFPTARCIRMDLDTTSQKWAHNKILKDFGSGKYNILLGTQMVAKGLDFENVTLVGVISADTSLLLPDFRASERTFQLITQVAGRAGRKKLSGQVFIQTYSPDSKSLQFARHHNFKGFFNDELPGRRELNYPPFGRLVYILIKGEDEPKVIAAAEKFRESINIPEHIGQVMGPIPAPISKIQKLFRWQIIIKNSKHEDASGKFLRQQLHDALIRFKAQHRFRTIKIQIDIDPVSLL